MLNKKSLVILHTPEDSEHFFTHHFQSIESHTFYCTHIGTCEYLLHHYGVHAAFITSTLDSSNIEQINLIADHMTSQCLDTLDNQYSAHLAAENDLPPIAFFSALYRYHTPFLIAGFLLFKEALFKICKTYEPTQIYIYNYRSLWYSNINLQSFLDHSFQYEMLYGTPNIFWLNPTTSKRANKVISSWIFVKKVLTNIHKARGKVIDTVFELLSYMSKREKTILYMDNLYDLTFIKRTMRYRLVPYSYQRLQHKFSFLTKYTTNPSCVLPKDFLAENVQNSLESFFSIAHKEHFSQHARTYIRGLQILEHTLNKEGITHVLWGSPPVDDFKSLFYAFCGARGIPVIGMQHGASHVDQYYKTQARSEFSRCDYFISYGFAQAEYDALFSEKVIILPFGTTKHLHTFPKGAKRTGILFPVTNSISIFEGGFARVHPEVLHQDQMDILRILEKKGQQGLKVVIKPFKQTTIRQTSVYYALKQLNHVKVEFTQSLTESLEKYAPECVVIDYMSTPLYEAIALDVEIFIYIREADKLMPAARELLEKRAYIISTSSELETLLEQWSQGMLPKRRDESYMHHYVKMHNAEANILHFMDNLN